MSGAIPSPPIRLHGVVLVLKKQRENVTLLLPNNENGNSFRGMKNPDKYDFSTYSFIFVTMCKRIIKQRLRKEQLNSYVRCMNLPPSEFQEGDFL
jgi:hypothetical protein